MNGSQLNSRRRWIANAAAGWVVMAAAPFAAADEFKFKDGRTLVGQGKRNEAQQWTVQLTNGAFVRFANSQLEINGHLKTDERIKNYESSLKNVEPNAESHAEFAGWCKSKGLKEQAEAHYRRALDFDPDFSVARAALGYINEAGRWVERDQLMTEGKGKVKVSGRFVYPEVYAFEADKKAREEKEGQWRVVINRLHGVIESGKSNAPKALAELRQTNDPFAIRALGEKLNDPKTSTAVQLEYVLLLSQFQSLQATSELIAATLKDDDVRVRDACLDSLSRFGREYAIASYIGVLRSVSGAAQPNAASTVQVNRAAAGLNALNAENATLPLIEALVTQYKLVRKAQNNYNAGGGLTTGGEDKTTIEASNNSDVLGALVKQTGKNFNYDEKLWLQWYASVYAAPLGDLRRDP
jgi:tetratricopeptide (TPR) repeat protein